MKRLLFVALVALAALPEMALAQFNQGGIQQTRVSNSVQYKNSAGTDIAQFDNETPRLGINGVVQTFTIANANDATTNGTDITFTAKDGYGNVVPFAIFDVILSDASTGLGMTATVASGSFGTLSATGHSGACDLASTANGNGATTNGACLVVYTAKKAAHVQASATGTYVLQLIDSAKTLFFPVATAPTSGVVVGARLTAGSYK